MCDSSNEKKMNKISIEGISPITKRFHNEEVLVYEKYLSINEIVFWKDNARTIFTLEKLEHAKGTKLDNISLDEIVTFVSKDDLHKISDLKKSILSNGVKVPLVVQDDFTLLDGNRRFFACYSIKQDCENAFPPKPLPEQITNIPVYVIKSAGLEEITRLKIIAEENFLPELKLPWNLDAQARMVEKYYITLKEEKVERTDEEMVNICSDIFGINKQRVKDLLGTLMLTKEFISDESLNQTILARRSIVESKFVYFWEFINKATKGNKKYTDESELQEVKDLFFEFMSMPESPIKNVKQIEPMAQAKRDPIVWEMLNEDKGSKLSLVVSIMNDRKEIRKAEDKIRAFHAWLEPLEDLSDGAIKNLNKLVDLIKTKG